MASETVSSDHPSSTPEPVKKEVCEEVKTMEHEGVSPPKESEKKPNDDKSSSPAAPQAELVEKVGEKQSEPPVIEEVIKANEEEKPKAQDSPTAEEVTKADAYQKPKAEKSPNETVQSAEPEEEIKDKHAEASDIQKPDDTPVADASLKDNPELEKAEISNVAEQTADNVESKPEEQTEAKSSEKLTEEPSQETTEEKKEEHPKKIDVAESLVEAAEREEEKKENSPDKEPEAAVVKDAETSEAEPVKEAPVLQPAVNEETGKESVAAETKELEAEIAKDKETSTDESKLTKEEKTGKESVVAELKELEVEVAKDKEDSTDKNEDSKLTKEEETGKESIAAEPKEPKVEVAKDEETSTGKIEETKLMEEEATHTEIPDQVISMNKDIAVEAKDLESAPAEAAAECVETKEKEPIDVVEEPVKEKVEAKTEATEAKNEENGVKTEEQEQPEATVKTEEDKTQKNEALVQPEKIVETEKEKGEKTEELTKPKSELAAEATSLAEKAVEGTNISRDIETVTENGSSKDDTIPSIENNKEGSVEKSVDEVAAATTTGSTPLGRLLKPETEAKETEKSEAVESKVEEVKVADETAKPDIQNTDSTKDADDNKTSQDTSKEEVPAKTKQSNNILTKVKRSLVKAKKAIIGKSPNSKTPSSETKDDVTA